MPEDIYSLIENSGLPRIAKELKGLVRHAIILQTQTMESEDTLTPGTSKIGGLPDLPPDLDWPEWKGKPLPLIAQINLSEIANYDYEKVLPSTGVMYCFFDERAFEVGSPQPHESWRVIYYVGDLSRLEHRRPSSNDVHVYSTRAITFATQPTLPPWESMYIERLGISYDALRPDASQEQKDEIEAYMNLGKKLDAQNNLDLPGHQLLGHPYQVQGDLLYTLQHDFHIEEDPTQWRLLLQIDTDDDAHMIWGDCGLLYFYISKQALARRDFSHVLMVMQCC